MEEKKKRFRPTLTAYRSLENEVSELKEALTAERNASKSASSDLLKWRSKYETCEKSVEYSKEQIANLSEARDALIADVCRLRGELERLKNRGLLSRILNK